MQQVTVVGLDLAKQVFQVHAVSADGSVVARRRLRRADVVGFFAQLPPCLVGMEACGGAHHWAREIAALGHRVRLMPPAYVKRGKTDAADAEAICEAVARPTMRFVPIKTVEQQAAAMVLKTRELLVRQRNRAINALRSHLAELGIVAGLGRAKVPALIAIVRDEKDGRLPAAARMALRELADTVEAMAERVETLEREIVAHVRQDDDMRRLTTIPGVGPIAAAAVRALVPDPGGFSSARHFAAWLGLTPRAQSSGGKERLGRISKMGNPTLRTLLVLGATAVLGHARRGAPVPAWAASLMARRPFKVAAVALANKMARTVWALLARGGEYRRPAAAAPAA